MTFSLQTTKLLSVGALSLAASSWCESSPETGCAADCGREIEDHNPQSQALFLAPTGAQGEGILCVCDIIQKNIDNEF